MPECETLPTNEALLKEAAAGSAVAFAQLVDRYYSMVHTIAYSRTRHHETAEDIAQEVFLRVYLSLDKITLPSHFPGWLVRVTHNLSTDWNRRGVKRSKLVQMVPVEETHLDIPDTNGQDARTRIKLHEDERAVQEAIFSLPEIQRDIVLLHYSEGLSQVEVAERLGLHPSTVSRQLKLAIEAMRGCVDSMIRDAVPALRPPQLSAARTIALLGAAAILSVETKAAILEAAGGAASLTALASGSGAALGASAQTYSLFSITEAGWRFLMSGKGLMTVLITFGIAGAGVLLHNQSIRAAGNSRARTVVSSPVAATINAVTPAASVSETVSAVRSASRVLQFPSDRSLGRIMVQDETLVRPADEAYWWNTPADTDWSFVSEARGAVTISPGKRVQLIVAADAVSDLSPLRNLPPDSIYLVSFAYPRVVSLSSVPQSVVTDECLQHVAALTGLRYLNLSHGHVSAAGLQHIKAITSLERLYMPYTFGRDSLAIACSIPSLRELYINGSHELADADLELFAGLPGLKTLMLSSGNSTRLTQDGLSGLRHLTSLEYLFLTGNLTPGTGKGLQTVAQLPNLRTLKLDEQTGTDATLRVLCQSRSIETLNLYGARSLTLAGVAHLKSMPSLKKLDLSHTKSGDDAAAIIKDMKQLESVTVPNLSDRGVGYLAQLPRLKALGMPAPHHVQPGPSDIMYTPEGLKAIAGLKNLEELSIAGNLLDDTAMETVAQFANLKKLSLFGCPITNTGLAKLAPLTRLGDLHIARLKEKGQDYSQFPTLGGLKVLNNMPDLRRLEVMFVAQDGAGLDLSKLQKLERLSLSLCPGQSFRDQDFFSLSVMTNMKDLQLCPAGGITDGALKHIAPLTKLYRLNIGGESVTDAGLKHLAGLSEIDQLWLKGNFTDAALPVFASLRNLRGLHVNSTTPFSESAVKEFTEKYPNIEMINFGPSSRTAIVGMEKN